MDCVPDAGPRIGIALSGGGGTGDRLPSRLPANTPSARDPATRPGDVHGIRRKRHRRDVCRP